MKKTITILSIVAITCLLTWRFVQSDSHVGIGPVEATEEHSANQTSTDDENLQIVAEFKWNGQRHQISLADLNAAIAELPVYRQQNYENRADKAEYLEELIEERLKILRATDEGFDKLPEHLKKLDDYTHQLMLEKLTEIEVDQKIVYTDDELMAHYEENISEYIEDAKVRATCISLDDEDLANETLDAIIAGKDIVEMANELFQAGKLANGPGTNRDEPGNTYLFTKAVSPRWEEFINATFAQEIGEITDTVFETEVNEQTFYLIFRKEEHHPERQMEFDEVKDDIIRDIERNKKQLRINEWLEEIYERGKLKTYPENIPTPSEPAEEENQTQEHPSDTKQGENEN